MLGSNTAYFGFTGATGGGVSNQVVTNAELSVVPEPSDSMQLWLPAALLAVDAIRLRIS